jgi:hypothetical protein
MGILHKDLFTLIITSSFIFLRMRNVPDKVVEKIKTDFMLNNFFFRKSCRLWDNVEKYGRARQAPDENIVGRRKDAICLPDNKASTRTHVRNI